jgi:hypothetical protein
LEEEDLEEEMSSSSMMDPTITTGVIWTRLNHGLGKGKEKKLASKSSEDSMLLPSVSRFSFHLLFLCACFCFVVLLCPQEIPLLQIFPSLVCSVRLVETQTLQVGLQT